MASIKIAVINQSTVLSDNEVWPAVAALQTQVSRDFAPVWGVDADLVFFPQGGQPPGGMWWLVLLDNSDQAGALGYHDLTPDSLPMGKVFAGADKQYGSQWTVTASHEVLEMLGDPDINLCASVNNPDGSMRLYAYEVADACEADQYGYLINNILVSDFVYPAWFESFRQPGSTQFDFQSKITQPFFLLQGGYISFCDVNSNHGWTQLTAQGVPATYEMRARVGSRRERRRILRSHWLHSKPVGKLAGSSRKARLRTFHNPIFSLLQSALHETLKRRRSGSLRLSTDEPEMQQFCAAAQNKLQGAPPSVPSGPVMAETFPGAAAPAASSISSVLSCAEMFAEMGWAEISGNVARRDALANEIKFSSCDPLWAEAVTTYLAWQAGQAPIPYVDYETLGDFVIELPAPKAAGQPLVIGVIADWGTGMEDTSWLLGRVLAQKVDLILHLGDIYYAGTTSEVADNFMQILQAAGVTVPVYTLTGNHDMYSGGIGYYGLLSQLHPPQPASYFCLRNQDWQILAMDTGYNDRDPLTVNTNLTSLKPAEAIWQLDKINNAATRKTILLSHHQLFSPYGDGVGQDPVSKKCLVTNPNLLSVFAPVLGKVSLWLWGHEHNLDLFMPYNGLAKGRCVGASAVPESDPNVYKQNAALVTDPGAGGKFPELVKNTANNQIVLSQNSDGEYFHCYTILRLAPVGGNSVAEYYQIDSVNKGPEALLYSEPI